MQQADKGHSANKVGKSTDNAEIFIVDPFDVLADLTTHADEIGTLMAVTIRMLDEALNGEIYAGSLTAHLAEVRSMLGATERMHHREMAQLIDVERSMYHHRLPERLRRKAA